jgi:hypothetical protein
MLNTYKENSGQIQLATGSPLIGRSGRSYCSAASCPARRNVKFLLPSDNKKGGRGDQNQLNYGRQTDPKLLRSRYDIPLAAFVRGIGIGREGIPQQRGWD